MENDDTCLSIDLQAKQRIYTIKENNGWIFTQVAIFFWVLTQWPRQVDERHSSQADQSQGGWLVQWVI